MKRAIIYIRVSTDEQADKGYSLQHQEESLRKHCQINTIDLVELVKEDYSAKTFIRPAFQSLLQKLKSRKLKADFLMFTKWDRFSRNAPDAYGMIATLTNLGIEPQAIEQPLDLGIPENKIMLAFYLAAPEVENDRRALNVTVGMRRAKKEGRWMASAPKGYSNITTEDGRKIITPNQDAPIIKWAFDTLLTGQYSVEEVRRMCAKKGTVFSRNRFHEMIRQPVYCGRLLIKAYKNEEEQMVKGSHEAIISEALFDEVQDVLKGRRRKLVYQISAKDELPLRGFLTCPRCQNKLTGSASTGGSKLKHYYYHCVKGCKERVKAKMVNDSFSSCINEIHFKEEVELLYNLILNSIFKSKAKDKASNQKTLHMEIEKLKDRMNKAQQFMLDGQMEMTEYREIKRHIEPKIEDLLHQQLNYNLIENEYKGYLKKGLTAIKNLGHLFENSPLTVKQDILRSILRKNLVFLDGRVRTEGWNELILLCARFDGQLSEGKNEKRSNFSSSSRMVTPRGFEPPTNRTGICHSIQLNYGAICFVQIYVSYFYLNR
jgi:site-specific DNA recombinase